MGRQVVQAQSYMIDGSKLVDHLPWSTTHSYVPPCEQQCTLPQLSDPASRPTDIPPPCLQPPRPATASCSSR